MHKLRTRLGLQQSAALKVEHCLQPRSIVLRSSYQRERKLFELYIFLFHKGRIRGANSLNSAYSLKLMYIETDQPRTSEYNNLNVKFKEREDIEQNFKLQISIDTGNFIPVHECANYS